MHSKYIFSIESAKSLISFALYLVVTSCAAKGFFFFAAWKAGVERNEADLYQKDQENSPYLAGRMVEKKISARSQDPSQRRILDRATRQRRLNRQLEALENDNFQDDPHANMPQLVKRLPQFDDDAETGKKKKKTRGDHFKLRFRKNFQALLEEQQNLNTSEGPNYLTACAPPSNLPQRHFCTVCGFPSNYTCVSCGARYCCVKCLGTHHETRCLKWTV